MLVASDSQNPPAGSAGTCDLAGSLKAAPWFHAIDFGAGLVSAGRFGRTTPPNYTLFGVFDLLNRLDLAGARVLDLGAMDGLVSFGLKKRGAGEVVATDLARRETFEAGARHLGLTIDYRVPVRIDTLAREWPGAGFDVIVNAGILYHTIDPLPALIACRRALMQNGWLVLETKYWLGERAPAALFAPANHRRFRRTHHNFFWIPSESALTGMLNLARFAVVSIVRTDSRIAILTRAVDAAALKAENPFIARLLERYPAYANYAEDIAITPAGALSTVRMTGAPVDTRLHCGFHRPDWPFQPAWNATRVERLGAEMRSLAIAARCRLKGLR